MIDLILLLKILLATGILLIIISLLIIILDRKKSKKSSSPKKDDKKTDTSAHAHGASAGSKKIGAWKITGIIIATVVTLTIATVIILFSYSFISNLFAPLPVHHPVLNEKVYEVSTGGTFIYLHPGWKGHPTKEVIISSPNGKTWIDTPGKISYPGYQPEGWYKFETKQKNCQYTVEDVY